MGRKSTRTKPEMAKYQTNANVYALYRGDEFLDIGDKYELALEYGLSPSFVRWLATPAAKASFERGSGLGYTVVRFSKDWEDDDDQA